MEVLAIWIIITELPSKKMIVTFTKRVQNTYSQQNIYSQPLCNYGSVNSKLAQYRIATPCRGGGGGWEGYSTNIWV